MFLADFLRSCRRPQSIAGFCKTHLVTSLKSEPGSDSCSFRLVRVCWSCACFRAVSGIAVQIAKQGSSSEIRQKRLDQRPTAYIIANSSKCKIMLSIFHVKKPRLYVFSFCSCCFLLLIFWSRQFQKVSAVRSKI